MLRSSWKPPVRTAAPNSLSPTKGVFRTLTLGRKRVPSRNRLRATNRAWPRAKRYASQTRSGFAGCAAASTAWPSAARWASFTRSMEGMMGASPNGRASTPARTVAPRLALTNTVPSMAPADQDASTYGLHSKFFSRSAEKWKAGSVGSCFSQPMGSLATVRPKR